MFFQAAAAVMVAFAPVQAEQLVGRWEGAMALPDDQFTPVALRVTRNETGEITALADSPMQGDMDRPVTNLTLEDGIVRFELTDIPGRFEGRLSGDTITGAWHGEDAALPVTLTRRPA